MVEKVAESIDLLIVPAFSAVSAADIDEILTSLSDETSLIARHGSKGQVAAVCGGSFLLGEAGLLSGRKATTAWPFAVELARRYPTAIVEAESLLVSDGKITTTGAFSASQDLALALIRQQGGQGLAKTVARATLLEPFRASQAPYISPDLIIDASPPFSHGIRQWLSCHLAQPYSLERLAAAFNVSSRTLLRRFGAETGRTPLKLLHDLRVDRAKELLEGTHLCLADVAEKVGYSDLSSFAVLFTRRTGLAPGAYRRRFRSRLG